MAERLTGDRSARAVAQVIVRHLLKETPCGCSAYGLREPLKWRIRASQAGYTDEKAAADVQRGLRYLKSRGYVHRESRWGWVLSDSLRNILRERSLRVEDL